VLTARHSNSIAEPQYIAFLLFPDQPNLACYPFRVPTGEVYSAPEGDADFLVRGVSRLNCRIL